MDFFDRQRRLKGFGAEKQELLAKATVLIAGVGGLGCPAALYLAAAGVGHLILVDHDTVHPSNLHRQILFGADDIDQPKASVAAARLSAMYPGIQISYHVTAANILLLQHMMESIDVLIDATDNFSSRYLLNDIALVSNTPLVHGSVLGFEGQFTVFHYPDASNGFDYRHWVPVRPDANEIPSCGEEGVLGVLPGIIGTMMAAETIKIITNLGEVMSGMVKHFDLRTQQWYGIKLLHEKLMGLPKDWSEIKQDSTLDCAAENENLYSGELLIDVREPNEICENEPLKGVNIPLGSLRQHAERWSGYSSVVLFCQSGNRSRKAIDVILSISPHIHVSHIEGGIDQLNETTRQH